MGLPLLLAAPALAAARGGLAVVVPLTAAPRDLARLRATLGRWNAPDFAPCRLDDRATPAAARRRRRRCRERRGAASRRGPPCRPGPRRHDAAASDRLLGRRAGPYMRAGAF